MREFDALQGYPEPKNKRVINSDSRTIENRIIASYRGEEFYDGSRNNGYGGMVNDGRWLPVAKNMINWYGLNEDSSILQIGSDKGYLLESFKAQFPSIRVSGIEISDYAINCTAPQIRKNIIKSSFTDIPFENQSFDLVVAIGPVYSLNLSDAIRCLKEIKRVSKGKSFITLGSYDAEEDRNLFLQWTLLGTTILSKKDWLKVLEHIEYGGDYKFNTAESLGLTKE
jgi:hypothetical protein